MPSQYGFHLCFLNVNVNNIENISMWLLAICKSSLEKCLFRVFIHFQMGYLFIIGLGEFFIYSTYKSLIRCITWKYFRLKTVSSFWQWYTCNNKNVKFWWCFHLSFLLLLVLLISYLTDHCSKIYTYGEFPPLIETLKNTSRITQGSRNWQTKHTSW